MMMEHALTNEYTRCGDALMPVLEVKELYDERYAQLMKDNRINP